MSINENYESTDKLTYINFNSILAELRICATHYSTNFSLADKSEGDFLFCEDLQTIENAINDISEQIEMNYEKKEWSNLSTLSYADINRWCNAINNIENTM